MTKCSVSVGQLLYESSPLAPTITRVNYNKRPPDIVNLKKGLNKAILAILAVKNLKSSQV